jgi:phosphoribosylformimino-5-aminoimidazole carboxamide ribotide isomerase
MAISQYKTMQLIPAIDIINGKCVRLTQGDYQQKKVYNENPLEIAKAFEGAGIQRLHLVDLDGAKTGAFKNWQVLEEICKKTTLQVDFGGGLRTIAEAQKAFDLGAFQITGGSIAVKNRPVFEEWLNRFGGDRVILGVDAKNEKIAVHGWQETTQIDLIDFIESYIQIGIQYVICTDIAKDGMLQGTSNDLYSKMQIRFPNLKIIASGGVSNIQDLEILKNMNIHGAIFGKAFYENRITLEQLNTFQKQ